MKKYLILLWVILSPLRAEIAKCHTPYKITNHESNYLVLDACAELQNNFSFWSGYLTDLDVHFYYFFGDFSAVDQWIITTDEGQNTLPGGGWDLYIETAGLWEITQVTAIIDGEECDLGSFSLPAVYHCFEWTEESTLSYECVNGEIVVNTPESGIWEVTDPNTGETILSGISPSGPSQISMGSITEGILTFIPYFDPYDLSNCNSPWNCCDYYVEDFNIDDIEPCPCDPCDVSLGIECVSQDEAIVTLLDCNGDPIPDGTGYLMSLQQQQWGSTSQTVNLVNGYLPLFYEFDYFEDGDRLCHESGIENIDCNNCDCDVLDQVTYTMECSENEVIFTAWYDGMIIDPSCIGLTWDINGSTSYMNPASFATSNSFEYNGALLLSAADENGDKCGERIQIEEECYPCVPPTSLRCGIELGSVSLNWLSVPGMTNYLVTVIVNDPDCCENEFGEWGWGISIPVPAQGGVTSVILDPNQFDPFDLDLCFSWTVSSVCDGEASEESQKKCWRSDCAVRQTEGRETTAAEEERWGPTINNPVSDYLLIQDLNTYREFELRIFNTQGQLMKNQTISERTHYKVDVSNSRAGLYILQVLDKSTGKFSARRFVKIN